MGTEKVVSIGGKLKVMFADFVKEHDDALNGKKSAAMRARKVTNEITKLCKEYRAESVLANK